MDQKGLSQNDVARICGIRQGSVSYILLNNIKKSKLSVDLSKGLGVNHEWLTDGKGIISEIKSYSIPIFKSILKLISALKNSDEMENVEYTFTSDKQTAINSFCFIKNKIVYICRNDIVVGGQTSEKIYLNITNIFNEEISVENKIHGPLSFEILEIRVPIINGASVRELSDLYDK